MPFSEDPIRRKLVWPSESVSPSPSRGPYSRSISGPYSGGFGAFAPVSIDTTRAAIPAPGDGAVGPAVVTRRGGFAGIFDDLKTSLSGNVGKILLVLAVMGGAIYGESQGWFGKEE